MLMCEGYKMFKGKADIVAVNPKFSKSDVSGVWLYKPEYDCWYCNGSSYPAEIVKNIRECEDGQD